MLYLWILEEFRSWVSEEYVFLDTFSLFSFDPFHPCYYDSTLYVSETSAKLQSRLLKDRPYNLLDLYSISYQFTLPKLRKSYRTSYLNWYSGFSSLKLLRFSVFLQRNPCVRLKERERNLAGKGLSVPVLGSYLQISYKTILLKLHTKKQERCRRDNHRILRILLL